MQCSHNSFLCRSTKPYTLAQTISAATMVYSTSVDTPGHAMGLYAASMSSYLYEFAVVLLRTCHKVAAVPVGTFRRAVS